MADTDSKQPVKEKRRIVPTYLGPATTAPVPPVQPPSDEQALLERQYRLLGPALILTIQQGRATKKDFEQRVAFLNVNDPGAKWTIKKLREATGVKTSKQLPPRLQAVVDKYTTEAKPRARKRKGKGGRKRTARKAKSRVKRDASYNLEQCLDHTVKETRAWAGQYKLAIPAKARSKAQICTYLQQLLHAPPMGTSSAALALAGVPMGTSEGALKLVGSETPKWKRPGALQVTSPASERIETPKPYVPSPSTGTDESEPELVPIILKIEKKWMERGFWDPFYELLNEWNNENEDAFAIGSKYYADPEAVQVVYHLIAGLDEVMSDFYDALLEAYTEPTLAASIRLQMKNPKPTRIEVQKLLGGFIESKVIAPEVWYGSGDEGLIEEGLKDELHLQEINAGQFYERLKGWGINVA